MTQKTRILIVEDEEPIVKGLCDVFTYNGYEVEFEVDGSKGLQKALSDSFHLILLDVMLPSLDGFQICNRIREVDRNQPIIMLTAKTSDEDIVNGLKLGADDYVAKPFSVRELLARVESVLRRSGKLHADLAKIVVGAVEIQPSTLEGARGEERIPFTRREVEIIQYLLKHHERPVSRQELLKEVWGYKNVDLLETRTVDIHITKLRRKIEADSSNPTFLVTVRGEGYRLLPSS